MEEYCIIGIDLEVWRMAEGGRKPCPFCGKLIREAARKCWCCTEWLDGGPPVKVDEVPGFIEVCAQIGRLMGLPVGDKTGGNESGDSRWPSRSTVRFMTCTFCGETVEDTVGRCPFCNEFLGRVSEPEPASAALEDEDSGSHTGQREKHDRGLLIPDGLDSGIQLYRWFWFATGLLLAVLLVFNLYALLPLISSPHPPRMKASLRCCMLNMQLIKSAVLLHDRAHPNEKIGSGEISGTSRSRRKLVPEFLRSMPVCPGDGTYFYDAAAGQLFCTLHGRFSSER